jgi:hypothetical protein
MRLGKSETSDVELGLPLHSERVPPLSVSAYTAAVLTRLSLRHTCVGEGFNLFPLGSAVDALTEGWE